VEYLGLLIWQNHLDPISILSSDDLEVIIRRANKRHPGRPQPCSDAEFRNRLLKVDLANYTVIMQYLTFLSKLSDCR
jgi:hypothetical protein